MKQSLKQKLNNLIREKGTVPFEEIAKFVNEEGYKLSNAERRLRQSESPEVEPIMGISRRGTSFIKAYQWRGAAKPPEPTYIHEGNKVIMTIRK